jgi:hypothetical protein
MVSIPVAVLCATALGGVGDSLCLGRVGSD